MLEILEPDIREKSVLIWHENHWLTETLVTRLKELGANVISEPLPKEKHACSHTRQVDVIILMTDINSSTVSKIKNLAEHHIHPRLNCTGSVILVGQDENKRYQIAKIAEALAATGPLKQTRLHAIRLSANGDVARTDENLEDQIEDLLETTVFLTSPAAFFLSGKTFAANL